MPMAFFCIVCPLWLCELFGPAYSTFAIFGTITHGFKTKRPEKARESVYTNVNLGMVPRLPVPRLPPGGSLGTPNILGTGAAYHLGPLRLHVENLECRAQKWSAQCQKCAMPCRFLARVNGV